MIGDLAAHVNKHNKQRDQLRALTNKLPSVDHTARLPLEREIALMQNQIRGVTDWISKHYTGTLEPEYRETILNISAAKSAVEDLGDALAKGEGEVIAAEQACYDKYVELRNAARPAGKPKPIRFDAPKPKHQTGQISTWTPGLPI